MMDSRRRQRHSELSYAHPDQPRLRRWMIRSVEGLSRREHLADLYEIWAREVADGRCDVFRRMLELVDIRLTHCQTWPPAVVSETPLVMIANHPFGIGDGIAMLALAEQLGRPFKVLLHKDLLRVHEMGPYALPIDFSETKEAVRNNLAARHEAQRLLKSGTTIVIFPAGGVATAQKVVGKARDLPWKMFVARLVQDAQASVIPVNFAGQNGRLFHLVSHPMHLAESDRRLARFIGTLSLTLRLSLLVREFTKLCGGSIEARIGSTLTWEMLAPLKDRRLLLERLQAAVLDLEDSPARTAARPAKLFDLMRVRPASRA